jgi:hypothetical protein
MGILPAQSWLELGPQLIAGEGQGCVGDEGTGGRGDRGTRRLGEGG